MGSRALSLPTASHSVLVTSPPILPSRRDAAGSRLAFVQARVPCLSALGAAWAA